MPQYNAKMNYPSNWTKIENFDPNNPQMVAFKSPPEDAQDTFAESLLVHSIHIPLGSSLDAVVQSEIDSLRRENQGFFVLIDSVRTTLSGIPAQQLVYTIRDAKYLFISAVKGDREYIIMYGAQPEKFDKFLPLIEQCISSFSFLS